MGHSTTIVARAAERRTVASSPKKAGRCVKLPAEHPSDCPKCNDDREWVVRNSLPVAVCLNCVRYNADLSYDELPGGGSATPQEMLNRIGCALTTTERIAADFLTRYDTQPGEQYEPGPLMYAVRDVHWCKRMAGELGATIARFFNTPRAPEAESGPCVRGPAEPPRVGVPATPPPDPCDGCGATMGWLVTGRKVRPICERCVRYTNEPAFDFDPVNELDKSLERLILTLHSAQRMATDLVESERLDLTQHSHRRAHDAANGVAAMLNLIMFDGPVETAVIDCQVSERKTSRKAVADV